MWILGDEDGGGGGGGGGGPVTHASTLGKTPNDHHAQQHAATGGDHTFPGGTAAYLRADGTWVVPPAGGSVAHSDTTGQTADDHHSQAHGLAGGDHTSSTIADLNTLIADGNVDDASAARPPTAHTHAHSDATGQGPNDHHSQAHGLGSGDHGSTTLAGLSALITDGNVDDSGASRPPTAHTHAHSDATGQGPNDHHSQAHGLGSGDHGSTTLAALNALISDADIDATGDPRPPTAHTHAHSATTGQGPDDHHSQAHGLGSADHGSTTLAALNALISDGNVDDASAPRTPLAHTHAHSDTTGQTADDHHNQAHVFAGGDHSATNLAALNAMITDGNVDDSSAARTPTAHAAAHGSGSGDEIDIVALGGYPGGTTDYLRADGSFAPPPAGGTVAHSDTTGQGPDDHHDRAHSMLSGADHTFPGGSTFLRADGTWAAPGGSVAHFDTTGQGPDDHHSQAHSLAGGDHTGSTITALNALITDGNVDDSGTARPPTAHTHAHSAATGQTANDHHSQAHVFAGGDHTATDLAALNAMITDGNVDDTSAARPPLAHTHAHSATTGQGADDHHSQAHGLGSADHGSTTMADLNALISDADIDATGDPRPPAAHTHAHSATTGQGADDHHSQAHGLGSGDHESTTMADLNALISDGNVDDATAPRTPTAHVHAHSAASGQTADDHHNQAHVFAGGDHSATDLAALNAMITDGNVDDSSAARTPTAHAAAHGSGSGDEIDIVTLGGYPGGTTDYLRADGSFATPPGGGGGGGGGGAATSIDRSRHNFFSSGVALVYLPSNTQNEQGIITDYTVSMLAASDGEIIAIEARSDTAAGDTIIGIHTNENTTPNATVTETMLEDISQTFDFAGVSGRTFSEGDEIAISFDPTTAPSGVNVTIVYQYDVSTAPDGAISWDFDAASTVAADPGAGKFRLNAATLAATTEVYVSATNSAGLDIDVWLAKLADTSALVIGSGRDSAVSLSAAVNGAPVDGTGWWTIPITVADTVGVLFTDVANCRFHAAGSAGGGSAGPSVSEVTAIASGSTKLLEQALIGAAGQIGKTVLGVAYSYYQGDAQGSQRLAVQVASLDRDNVLFAYASGADFLAGVIQEGPVFLGDGEPYIFESMRNGAIITASKGAYGYSQQRRGNDESPMPLLSLALAFDDTFFYAFRDSNTYRGGAPGTNNEGWIHIIGGPLASTVTLTSAGTVVAGQVDVPVAPWEYVRFYTNGNTEFRIKSTEKVMAAVNAEMGTNGPRFYDSRLILPLTTDGITWPRSGFVSALYDGTNVDWWLNDNLEGSFTVSPGSPVDFDAGPPTGTGATDSGYQARGACRILLSGPGSAYSGADGDGLEATPLCPTQFMTQKIALPLQILNLASGSGDGLAIASPYVGTAKLYQWNPVTKRSEIVSVTPPSGGAPVTEMLLQRRDGATELGDAADSDAQLHPASLLLSGSGGGGSDPNAHDFLGNFLGGYVEVNVPCTVVFNSSQNQNGGSAFTARGTSGAATIGIHADGDESLSFGITPPDIRAEIRRGADGRLYRRDIGAGGSETWSVA